MSLSHVPGGGVPLVGSNHRDGATAATRHLIQLGHTSIGTVTGPFRRHVARSRPHGYEDALREAGLEPSEDLPVELLVRDSCGGHRAPATTAIPSETGPPRPAPFRQGRRPPVTRPPATGTPGATAARSDEEDS